MYKLGKMPARPGAVRFALRDYLVPAKLPPLPEGDFGHTDLVAPGSWGMFANDAIGDCVWAGAAHETMIWNKEAGRDVAFSDAGVIADYSAVTGYAPNDPSTDNGTDMAQAMSYRRNTGVVDMNGARHKVAAYMAITPKNVHEHMLAVYLFGAVGMGFEFPGFAMQQFIEGQPWAPQPNPNFEGGHYVPLMAFKGGSFVCVSWGKTQVVTPAFLEAYNDESYAILTEEMLSNGKSLEGFDLGSLQADLEALNES